MSEFRARAGANLTSSPTAPSTRAGAVTLCVLQDDGRQKLCFRRIATGYGEFVRSEEEIMGLRIRHGHGRRSDLLVILMLAAMVCVMGSALVYLGERVHAPEQTRIIDSGPPDPPLRIE
jgi:hypothetical protein